MHSSHDYSLYLPTHNVAHAHAHLYVHTATERLDVCLTSSTVQYVFQFATLMAQQQRLVSKKQMLVIVVCQIMFLCVAASA